MNSSSANNFLLKSIQPSAAPGPAPKHNYQDDQAASFMQNFKDVQANVRAQQEDARERPEKVKVEKPSSSKRVASADKPEHDPEKKPAEATSVVKNTQPKDPQPKETQSREMQSKDTQSKDADSKVEHKKSALVEETDSDQIAAEINPAIQVQAPQTLLSEAVSPIPVITSLPDDAQKEVEVDSDPNVLKTLDTSAAPVIGETGLLQGAGKPESPSNPSLALAAETPAAAPTIPAAPLDTSVEQGPLVLGLAGQGIASKPVATATPLVAATEDATDSDTARVLANLLPSDNTTAKTTAAPATSTDVEPKVQSAQTHLLDPKASFEKAMQGLIRGESGSLDESKSQVPQPATPTTPGTGALDSLLRFSDASAPAARSFVVQTTVPVPLGQPQWSQQVGEKVLWLAAQNISSAEINLNPEHLGPMQVKVSVHQEQTTVSFTSHHAVVREVLDQNLGRLRDMFSEQGLNLVNVDVSDKSFSRQQGDAQDQKRQAGNKEVVEEETPVAMSLITQQRLVDHYA